MKVVYINGHIITIQYKNFKMTSLTYIIFILNFVFIIVFYTTR
jgi:hypothetical protein